MKLLRYILLFFIIQEFQLQERQLNLDTQIFTPIYNRKLPKNQKDLQDKKGKKQAQKNDLKLDFDYHLSNMQEEQLQELQRQIEDSLNELQTHNEKLLLTDQLESMAEYDDETGETKQIDPNKKKDITQSRILGLMRLLPQFFTYSKNLQSQDNERQEDKEKRMKSEWANKFSQNTKQQNKTKKKSYQPSLASMKKQGDLYKGLIQSKKKRFEDIEGKLELKQFELDQREEMIDQKEKEIEEYEEQLKKEQEKLKELQQREMIDKYLSSTYQRSKEKNQFEFIQLKFS